MGKDSVYAPVIMLTMNRFEHFKRCIDSLSRCTGAEYTEVYLGIDYPSKPEYQDGHEKICEYIDHIHGFKKLHIFKREHNYGASFNCQDLREKVKEKFDRYIFSEDDNEFSLNFLEYMNEGLKRYKDNNNIIAICGYLLTWNSDYNDCMRTFNKNIFPAKNYNAVGVGRWFAKELSVEGNLYTKTRVLNSSFLTLRTIMAGYSLTIARYINQIEKASEFPDVGRRLYCAFHNKYCIFPTISKVRNWGFDGSGLNSDYHPEMIESVELDTADHFEFDDIEIKDYKEVKTFLRQMYNRHPDSGITWPGVLKQYIFYKITGKRPSDVKNGKYTLFLIRYVLNKLSFGLIKN